MKNANKPELFCINICEIDKIAPISCRIIKSMVFSTQYISRMKKNAPLHLIEKSLKQNHYFRACLAVCKVPLYAENASPHL